MRKGEFWGTNQKQEVLKRNGTHERKEILKGMAWQRPGTTQTEERTRRELKTRQAQGKKSITEA